MSAAGTSSAGDAATLEELYDALGDMEMTAGWIDRKSPILHAEPKTQFQPMHWQYASARDAMDATNAPPGARRATKQRPFSMSTMPTTWTILREA